MENDWFFASSSFKYLLINPSLELSIFVVFCISLLHTIFSQKLSAIQNLAFSVGVELCMVNGAVLEVNRSSS